jgi:hypothetical protein
MVQIRSAPEVARRAVILLGIFQAATGRSKREIMRILNSNKLWNFVSPNEAEFLRSNQDEYSAESIELSWRSEAIYILLWALNYFDFFEWPESEHNLDEIKNMLMDDAFYTQITIEHAQFRDINDINARFDQIVEMHEAIRDAEINDTPVPLVPPTLIYEWHYALKWLLSPQVDWDNITTDT